jgi:glycosyltransferase involved in cell wall biosynthesis
MLEPIKTRISVIIPTYNGKHKLVHILKSLELQSCMPDEFVIVVDGSTDDTKPIIE